ncbi:hypothetical protein BGW80DRAFT_1465038 [Lactifluus volemus]|nr:hypothetical protein BGW80DRAFT_1465038 [Lactifluus volemus]
MFEISFFYQDIFDIRKIVHHSRTFGPFNRAEMIFDSDSFSIKLCQPEGTDPSKALDMEIHDGAEESNWQRSKYLMTFGLYLIDFEVLDDPTEWLKLFRPFTAVPTLFISDDPQSDVVSSLQELRMEGVMEALPALRKLYCCHYPRDEYEEDS